MAKSAQQVRARWQTGASGAGASWSDGVQNTQIDVIGRAIQALPAAAAGYAEAISSGRTARALQAVGTAGWKSAVAKKQGNYATGIAAGGDKFERSMSKLLPFLESTVAGLPARVPGNPSANLQRVSGVVMALHANKGNFKG
jgi:hypothetical protein